MTLRKGRDTTSSQKRTRGEGSGMAQVQIWVLSTKSSVPIVMFCSFLNLVVELLEVFSEDCTSEKCITEAGDQEQAF